MSETKTKETITLEDDQLKKIKEVIARGESGLDVLVEEVTKTVHRPQTKEATKVAWATTKRPEVDVKVKAAVQDVAEILLTPKITVPRNPRKFTKTELAVLADEAWTVQAVQAVLEGRNQFHRQLVFDAITLQNQKDKTEDPEFDVGELVSKEAGLALVRGLRGGKDYIDEGTLKDQINDWTWDEIVDIETVVTTVGPKVFDDTQTHEVTSTEREIINEGRLIQAVEDGRIPLQAIADSIKKTAKTSTFHIKELKQDEG